MNWPTAFVIVSAMFFTTLIVMGVLTKNKKNEPDRKDVSDSPTVTFPRIKN